MQDLSRKVLLLNIMLTQAILLLTAIVLKALVIKEVSLYDLLKIEINGTAAAVLSGGILFLLIVEFVFYRFVPKHELADEVNLMLMEKFTLPELSLIFLTGALIEEFLFRFLLQSLLGSHRRKPDFCLYPCQWYIVKKYMLAGSIYLELGVLGMA